MAYSPDSAPHIVVKAQLETVALVVSAGVVALALASTIHARPTRPLNDEARSLDWTGHLASVSGYVDTASTAPLSSASLVVAKTEVKLPAAPMRALAKLHGCDGSACASAPLPPIRGHATTDASPRGGKTEDPVRRRSLISRLNPLEHIPSVIKRPFSYAGDTVAGWIRGL